MIDYVRKMTVKKSYKHGKYGSFEHCSSWGFVCLLVLVFFVFGLDFSLPPSFSFVGACARACVCVYVLLLLLFSFFFFFFGAFCFVVLFCL